MRLSLAPQTIAGYAKASIGQLRRDTAETVHAFARSRSPLVIAILLFLPWFFFIVTGRNQNPWGPLAEIYGIIFVYWFFTRGRIPEMLPVRQPIIETALALILVLIWMLFRIGQYTHIYTLPVVTVGSLDDIYETIVPKLLEMTILPLAIWFGLRYRPRELGLSFNWRAWIPALAPLAVLVYFGLQNHDPSQLWDRIVYFFFGAGLPEELMFRGILQPRLQALLKNQLWGLFISAFIFGVTHLPIDLSGSSRSDLIGAVAAAFTFQMSVGFALGYAFQRLPNLPPIMFIHTMIDAAL